MYRASWYQSEPGWCGMYMFRSFYGFAQSIKCAAHSKNVLNACQFINWRPFYRMRRATWLAQSIDCATVELAHSIKCAPQDLRNL